MGKRPSLFSLVGGGAGVGGPTGAGTAISDNKIARGDGTTAIQGSLVDLNDNGRITVPDGVNSGYYFGDANCGWYEGADNQPTLKCAGTDVLDFPDLSARRALRFSGAAGIRMTGTAGSNKQLGDGTTYFTFEGSSGQNWYAEGAAGASHWVGAVQGDFSGVSRGLRHYVSVEANAAVAASPNLITADESGRHFTNEGATAKNYHTLPTAVAGLRFTFIVQDADGIRIVANTGDTLRIDTNVGTAAGYTESTALGSSITFVAINATEWVATSFVGSWANPT